MMKRVAGLPMQTNNRRHSTRRGFLRGTAAAAAALAALPGSRLILGGGSAWALELNSLSAAEGDALLRFLRDMFPHDYVPDVFYANALAPLDDQAAGSPATRELLIEGISDLNDRAMRAAGSKRKSRHCIDRRPGRDHRR
jgi:hypothetical protein